VRYARAPRLFEELTLCHADGSFRKHLAAIARISVLITDDFAITPVGERERNDLLELIDDRVGSRSCIVTSRLPIEDWHDYIGDPTWRTPSWIAFCTGSHRIHLEAKDSIRKTEAAEEFAKARAKKRGQVMPRSATRGRGSFCR
jgi:DNA replication protein DnaC